MTENPFREGELCPLILTARCQVTGSTTDKTPVTHRASVMSEDRPAADRLDDLLELQERAASRGLAHLAEWYGDRIVDEMTAGLAR